MFKTIEFLEATNQFPSAENNVVYIRTILPPPSSAAENPNIRRDYGHDIISMK